MKGRTKMKIVRNLTKKMEQLFHEDLTFTKGAMHCHTQNSLDDGFQTEADLCRVAKDYGADVAIISDHGTCMGWDDFDEAAKKIGIKSIFGVEAYYLDDVTNMKSHLTLYAKNNEGMRQIQMALSRGTIIDDGRTCLNDETLEMLKGGNVVATSACINGVLGSVVIYNDRINNKIEKLENEINEFADSLSVYEESKRQLDAADSRFSILKAEVSEAKAASKKSFSGKQKQVEAMKKKLEKAQTAFDKFLEDGTQKAEKSVITALAQLEVIVEDSDEFQEGLEKAEMKYNQRVAQIKSEIEAAERLAKTLDEKTALMEDAKEEKAKAKAELDAVAKDVAKVETKEMKIRELEAQKLTKEQSNELFKKRLAQMLDIFDKDFYIEIQNHGIDLEETIYKWLVGVARKNRIPLIAANDAHFARNSEQDVAARQIRTSCRWKKWNTPREDDVEYYIKNDKELALALYQIFPEDVVVEAMTNVAKVINMCNAEIITESHAPKAKGVNNVKDEMVRIARENIANKYGDSWGEMHEERFNYEVSIIDSMGFNDYFVITWDILNIARKIGGLSYEKLDELKAVMNDMTLEELMSYIEQFDTEVNISVGLGRGSGAGSLVCYLLGITNIDPFKYDLLFEREKDCVH
jgi:DNA polymerase-3 subunit alpha